MNEIKIKKAAGYARQSAGRQAQSILDQIKAMKEAAESQGTTLADDLIFTDDSSTNAKNRPGLESLKKAARDGSLEARGVTHLYCWSVDRITRNMLDARSFEAEMARAGIKCYRVMP